MPSDSQPSIPTLTWVSHPAKERPLHLALVTAIVLAFALAILWADGSLLLAFTAAGILIAATAGFFLPTRFTLGQRGVVVAMPGYTKRRPWGELRRWEEDGNGVVLSPFSAPHPILEWKRGIFLRGGERGEIISVLEARLGPAFVESPRNTSGLAPREDAHG